MTDAPPQTDLILALRELALDERADIQGRARFFLNRAADELVRVGQVLEQLREALREDPEKWSFWTLVRIAHLICESEYPADIFTGESGDPGPVFIAALREALAELDFQTGYTLSSVSVSQTPGEAMSLSDLVAADLQQRERIGVETYGQPLRPFNGRDALRDAYEEALDLAMYLRQALEEAAVSQPQEKP